MEPGESVLMISMVKKMQKLSSKKVQLILTNKPKLIYVDPSKLVVKGNIIWSDSPNDLNLQVSSPSHFKICTVSVSLSKSVLKLFNRLCAILNSFALFISWFCFLYHFLESIVAGLLGFIKNGVEIAG